MTPYCSKFTLLFLTDTARVLCPMNVVHQSCPPISLDFLVRPPSPSPVHYSLCRFLLCFFLLQTNQMIIHGRFICKLHCITANFALQENQLDFLAPRLSLEPEPDFGPGRAGPVSGLFITTVELYYFS